MGFILYDGKVTSGEYQGEDRMIVLKDINKTIENKHIIKDCTFHIKPGECVGLLGKNGAGKTTLLNLMSGMLIPDSGFLRINYTKELLESKHARKDLVYISGVKSQLWQDLRIKDSFAHCIEMYGTDKNRLDELIKICEVEPLLDSYPQNLSLGERMRCEIAYGLLANSSILFMDEVMIGLDITIKQRILAYLQQIKSEKRTTMIYTNHNLMEVQRLCDRVLLIDEGRIIFDGSMERIMREYAPLYQLEMISKDNLFPDFEDLPVRRLVMDGERFRIYFDNREIEKTELVRYVTDKCVIEDLKLVEPNLKETIKEIYKREEFYNGEHD